MNFGEMFGMAYQPEYLLTGGVTPKLVSYTTAGSFTETIPAGYSLATVEAWGGGGGTPPFIHFGGCCPYDQYAAAGASGGYCRSTFNVVGQGGKTLSLVVGAGGARSTTVSYGGAGGDTTVSSGTFTITTMTAGGGEMGLVDQTGYTASANITPVSCSGTSLTVTAPNVFVVPNPAYLRNPSVTALLPNTIIIAGPVLNAIGTWTVNNSQTFSAQTIAIDGGNSGSIGGVASGGSVNTAGNPGAGSPINAPPPATVGITGLYGGPYGNGAGNDSTAGNPGAIIIRYS